MHFSTLIFGFIISTLYGALMHLWRGGGAGRLLFYLCLSWAGFLLGQVSAARLGWTFDLIGAIHIFFASLGSIVFLLAGYWLSLVQAERE